LKSEVAAKQHSEFLVWCLENLMAKCPRVTEGVERPDSKRVYPTGGVSFQMRDSSTLVAA